MEKSYLPYKSELTSRIALYPICKKSFEKGFKLLDEGKIKEGLKEIHYATELLLKIVLNNNKSLEQQTDKDIEKNIELNGWGSTVKTLFPMLKDILLKTFEEKDEKNFKINLFKVEINNFIDSLLSKKQLMVIQ